MGPYPADSMTMAGTARSPQGRVRSWFTIVRDGVLLVTPEVAGGRSLTLLRTSVLAQQAAKHPLHTSPPSHSDRQLAGKQADRRTDGGGVTQGQMAEST